MIVTDLELLLHELGKLPEPLSRARVVALIGSFAGRRLYLSRRQLVRTEHLRMAAAMLAAGMDRPEIAKALMQRLQVSESTAYRIIRQALTVHRPTRPPRPETMEPTR